MGLQPKRVFIYSWFTLNWLMLKMQKIIVVQITKRAVFQLLMNPQGFRRIKCGQQLWSSKREKTECVIFGHHLNFIVTLYIYLILPTLFVEIARVLRTTQSWVIGIDLLKIFCNWNKCICKSGTLHKAANNEEIKRNLFR